MTRRNQFASLILTPVLGLSGCFGSSDDKGDNSSSTVLTPKPGKVEDANTAGSRTTPLPEPVKPDVKATNPDEAGPK